MNKFLAWLRMKMAKRKLNKADWANSEAQIKCKRAALLLNLARGEFERALRETT